MLKNTYDELVYKSKAFSFATARYMEAISTLYGLNPVDSKKCRVLEIGSSFGGNIISQALFYPDNEYVGIDLSETQIIKGNEIIKQLGLKNIKLIQKNIMDIDKNFGEFDYIICHGVFSWVPDNVKNKILDVIDNNLSERGIAYISYNTYPGWKEIQKIRDIMRYANKYYENIPLYDKVERSKAILKIIEGNIRNFDETKHSKFLDKLGQIFEKDNYYLAHEYLEEYNDPMYIHEFADMVNSRGLRYFSDCSLTLSFLSAHKNQIVEEIKKLSLNDNVVKEQCIDYVLDTQFRKSLICKKSQENMLNFTENIPENIIDKYYYSDINLEVINDDDTKDIFKEVVSKNEKLRVIDLIDEINKRSFSEERKKELYKNVRLVLLNGIIYSKVRYYINSVDIVRYEDNKVYIPQKYINFIKTSIENEDYIQSANINNEAVNFQKIDLELAKLMSEIKPRKQIIEEFDKIIKYYDFVFIKDSGNVPIDANEYFDSAIKVLENIGFFKN